MADLKCPNCGSATVAGDDGRRICTHSACGGSFVWKDGDARLVATGEYEALKGRVEQLEKRLTAPLVAASGPEPPATQADDEEDDEQDDDL